MNLDRIFREYDIRGLVGEDLTEEVATAVGRALGGLFREQGRGRMAVGRDARPSSVMLTAALGAGLRSEGVHVVDVGICPTPLVYFSLYRLPVDGGVMVTGSHNPAEFNGFKLCIGKETIHGAALQDMKRRIESMGPLRNGQARGSVKTTEVIPLYLEYIREHFRALASPAHTNRRLRIVVDAGNGTAGPVAPQALRSLGCDVVELYCELDGRFPHHHPDPVVPENLKDLQQCVRAERADLGVAYDGDADRLGVVDDQGEIIWGDQLLVLFARDILPGRPGATVIGEVKCSQVLYDEIARLGGQGIMWKAGHSLIKAKIRETGAILGGELSGHVFFADRFFGYDDAIYATCRLVEILAKSGRSLRELLADLPRPASTPEIRVDCPDERKFAVIARLAARLKSRYPVVDIDGVRVLFPDGWALARASNTQPALVLRFEAASPGRVQELQDLMMTELAEVQTTLEGGI